MTFQSLTKLPRSRVVARREKYAKRFAMKAAEVAKGAIVTVVKAATAVEFARVAKPAKTA